MDEFWQRLKQRKLVQWALAYAAFWFALLQGIDIVAARFDWPDSIERYFILALAIGFCVTLVLAWYHGEKGAQRVGGMEITILALLLAIGGVLIWRFGPVAIQSHGTAIARSNANVSATPATPKSFNPPTDSLVVLPFTNLSGDPKQQYFSDGITEELTNALGQNAALTVIAWDTASHYRNSSQGPDAIGKALNVANLLHGSIQREGDQVRVVVELVNTLTGAQIWSDHYDDSLANVFAVQDKISAAIADALKVKFASLGQARTVNPQAHDLVLKANALTEKARTAAPYEQARTWYEQAIALDPNYADAHAGLAHAWFDLTQFSTLPLKDVLPKVRAEAHRALALDPRNVMALVDLGNADLTEGRNAEAKRYYQRALALDPSNASAHVDYGNLLPLQQGLAQEQEAVQLDPDNATAQNNLTVAELDAGDYAQALAPMQALARLDPASADGAMGLALVYSLLHRPADAVKAVNLAKPTTELAKTIIAAGRLTYQSVLDPSLHAKALAVVDALRQRTDLDPFSMGDVIQLYLALGQNKTALDLMPQNCAAAPIGCSDLSVNPMYIPLRGQPRFEALVKQYDTVSQPAPAASAAPASASL